MLTTEQRQDIIFFTGKEVEHTKMFGCWTLFVVGTPPIEQIIERCQVIDHVYLGTSQSFNPNTEEDWYAWSTLIGQCIDVGFTVTLDLDVKYASELRHYAWASSDKFIPMISVKMPYIDKLSNNACLKIDDTTWGYSNQGVWTHRLKKLKDDKLFTPWDHYEGDS
jgi:hypothetical protein